MKSKQLAIMVAVAAILGVAAILLNKKDAPSSPKGVPAAGSKVVNLPVNDVSGISIQSATGKLNLTKKDDVWVVDRAGYPANYSRIHDLLTKIWELKTVQAQSIGPTQFARLELAEPLAGAGTKIEFKDKDGKVISTLLLGKKHMKEGGGFGGMGGGDGGFPAGRYVTQPGATYVSLVTEPLEEVDPKADSWLSHDFFKIENPSSITLAGQTDAQKWKVTRENATAEWKLDGAKPEEKIDASKVSLLGTAFANASFSDVLAPDAKPEDTGLDKPTVVTLETVDGFKYVLKIGKETNGNQPVTMEVAGNFAKERVPGKDEKPEDKTKLDEEFKTKIKGFEEKLAAEKKYEGRAFLVAKSTLEQVVKDRSAMLVEKPAEPAPAAPAPGTPPAAGVPSIPGIPVRPPAVTTPPFAVPPANTPGGPAKPPQKPVTATTPPVSVTPTKPERKPVTATTPPVTVPPTTKPDPAKPAKPEAAKPNAAKPEAPKPATPPAEAPKPEKPADAPPANPDAPKPPAPPAK